MELKMVPRMAIVFQTEPVSHINVDIFDIELLKMGNAFEKNRTYKRFNN